MQLGSQSPSASCRHAGRRSVCYGIFSSAMQLLSLVATRSCATCSSDSPPFFEVCQMTSSVRMSVRLKSSCVPRTCRRHGASPLFRIVVAVATGAVPQTQLAEPPQIAHGRHILEYTCRNTRNHHIYVTHVVHARAPKRSAPPRRPLEEQHLCLGPILFPPSALRPHFEPELPAPPLCGYPCTKSRAIRVIIMK